MLGGYKVHTFPKGISSKVNVIEQLDLGLAYFKATVQSLLRGDSPLSHTLLRGGICLVPHIHQSLAQGLFSVGPKCRAVSYTHTAVPKILWVPSAFPWKEAPQVPGHILSPARAEKNLGGWPLRTKKSNLGSRKRPSE